MADSAGHMVLLKHIEFVWFHYDLLLRCGENRHRNLTAALYDRPSSDNGPLGRQELPPSFSSSLAEDQVKANTHSKCLHQDHVPLPFRYRLLAARRLTLQVVHLPGSIFKSDGCRKTCFVGVPHPRTCFIQFRWSENCLSGGNTPSSDLLFSISME